MERQKKIYATKEESNTETSEMEIAEYSDQKLRVNEEKNTLRRWMPRFNDEQQKKAGKNLLRFFVMLIILTLVARGTFGATLPKVDTIRAEAGEIVQRVRGTGTVVAATGVSVNMPIGLTIRQILVTPGQIVSDGDRLARFDEDELKEQLKRAITKLDEMKLELRQILRNTNHDNSELESARLALARAQQDYNNIKALGEDSILLALQILEQAQTVAQESLDYMNSIPDISSQEYTDAYNDWIAKSADIKVKEEALAQAQGSAETNILSAARVLEDSQAFLARAEKSDAEIRQNESDESAKNNLAAVTLQMDIGNQQEIVAQLQTLSDNDGWLSATVSGVLQETPRINTKSVEDMSFRIADSSSGYEAEMWIDKKDAEKLAIGDNCEIATSTGAVYYREIYAGRVTEIEPGDDKSSKVTVRLLDGNWKSGQTVEVQVMQGRQAHNYCVPLTVLHSSNDGYYILVLQQSKTVLGTETIAAKIPVTIKAQDGQMAAIEGSFGDRDDIISSSNKAVHPDDSVRVIS